MKITGPGGPPKPDAAAGTTGPDATAPADRSRETQPSPAVQAPAGAPAADPVAQVAAELRAGTISPRQAIDRLVEMTLGSVGAGLPEAARAELRARLEATLASDPTLGARLRRLGVPLPSPTSPSGEED